MVIKIVYFVHGTTTDNQKDVSSGWSDVGLSELGIKQSINLKDQIKNRRFDVVFCSDLKRAVDSAKLTFEGVVPIISDKRLRECNYGKYNCQPSSIVEPMQEKYITENFPNGESYEDVKIRIADFLKFLKENYDGKGVAIVSHKAPQFALEVLLKNKTWKQAFAEDWRKTKSWQPGWEYELFVEESIFKNNFIKTLNKINPGWIDGDEESGSNKKADIVNHQLKIAIEIKDDNTKLPEGVAIISAKHGNETISDKVKSANDKFKEYPDYRTICLFRTEFMAAALKYHIEGLDQYAKVDEKLSYIGKVGKYSKFAKNEVGGYLIVRDDKIFYFTNFLAKPERILKKKDVENLTGWNIADVQ